MLLGVLEVIAHSAAIKMFRLKQPYSSGLVTAVVVLLPISIYRIVCCGTARSNLMSWVSWLLSFFYMMGTLMLAQQIVLWACDMKYSDFLRNVRATIYGGAKYEFIRNIYWRVRGKGIPW
jgi:hypothetical protein